MAKYDQGLIRFSDGTAYWSPVPILGGPQFIPVPANATSIGYALLGGAVVSVTEVIGGTVFFSGGSGGGGSSDLLEYVASTDLLSGASIAANTWTDLTANQSFTNSHPLVVISGGGCCLMGGVSGGGQCGSRLLIDSGGTPTAIQLGGDHIPGSNFGNALSGAPTTFISGLASGVHTVKLQIYANLACNAYCRASTQGNLEKASIRVVEHS